MIELVIACLLAAILRFAAHRASICTVRAVAEMITTRQGYMFASLGKSALWIVAIMIAFLWFDPSWLWEVKGWELTGIAVLGGFTFGVGAAINGYCAYSTMARLADGHVSMFVTVIGFM